MVYVDENLCTGCGVCIDSCNREAITMRGDTAFIDENLCTSCGRCVDACLTSAIIMEPDELPVRMEKAGLPAIIPDVAPPLVAPAQSSITPAQRFFSGLLSLVGFALDVKRSFAPDTPRADSRDGSAASGLGRGPGRGAGQGRGGGRGQGKGQGPRGGQGPGCGGGGGAGGGRGRSDRSGTRGRYRAP